MYDDEDFQLKRNGTEAFMVQTWQYKPSQTINAVLRWEEPEEVPLKIALVGSHSTGKTTVAKKLSEELDIPLIEEVARAVHDLGFHINKETDISAQLLMFLGQLYEEEQQFQFVSDRGLIDYFVYTWHYAKKRDLGLMHYHLTAMANLTHSMMANYSVVFYLPVEVPPKRDGVRSVDKKFQKEIDELMVEFLEAFDVDYFPLPGDIDEKFNSAIEYLKDQGLWIPE